MSILFKKVVVFRHYHIERQVKSEIESSIIAHKFECRDSLIFISNACNLVKTLKYGVMLGFQKAAGEKGYIKNIIGLPSAAILPRSKIA